jgi:hypothetical protein
MGRRPLTIALIASAVLLIPAAGAHAAAKAIWGPSTFGRGSPNCPTTAACSAFPTYRELGVGYYQFQLHFSAIAPTRPANPRNPNDPAYLWPADADATVASAAANGVGLMALVQFSPPWANGGQNEYGSPDPKAFGDFLYAASKHYPSIKLWQIWGEPDLGINFSPIPPNSPVGPRTYGQLLDASYGALKEASPANLVIGGGTLSQGVIPIQQWIKWLRLPNGQMPRMDFWGHNAFDDRFPNLCDNPLFAGFRGLNDIDTLWNDLRKAYGKKKKKQPRKCQGKKKGKKGKKKGRKAVATAAKKKGKGKGKRKKQPVPRLWIGEWTVVSDHPTNVFGNPFFVSRAEQAQRLSAAYAMVNRLPYVVGLGWFTLVDQPEAPGSADWGLMQANGARKPSFAAYAAVP